MSVQQILIFYKAHDFINLVCKISCDSKFNAFTMDNESINKSTKLNTVIN